MLLTATQQSQRHKCPSTKNESSVCGVYFENNFEKDEDESTADYGKSRTIFPE
jgi:hypothetical protein